ncbi:MAG: hypothetical protein ABSG15_13905 [FCB group bacterium]
MLKVLNVSFDSKGVIWAGTSGGVFTYNKSTGDYHEYRNNNGLLSLNISVVKCNPAKKIIYIGTDEGNLDIVTEDNKWTHITDIVSQKFSYPKINDIFFGDTLAYIGGGFGLAVFNQKQNVFVESVNKLGDFPPNTNVNQIITVNSDIWLATDKGIAKTSLNNSISVPQVWQNYSETEGLYDPPIVAVTYFQGNLYAASYHNIYKFNSGTFTVIDSVPSYSKIKNFTSDSTTLYFCNEFTIKEVGGPTINVTHPSSINSIAINNNMMVVCYDKGIGTIENKSLTIFTPNTPYSNLFLNLSVDPNGVLWSATNTSGQGIMRLESNTWTNFNEASDTALKSDAYFMIFATSDGRAIASNWGTGFTIIDKTTDGYKFQNYDTTNTPLQGVRDHPGFVIAGGCREDSDGLLWIVNYGETSPGPALVALDKKGVFHSFINNVSPTTRGFLPLAIDNYGTKWLGSSETPPAGLYYINDNGTLDDVSDDRWGLFTVSNSAIPDNTQTALAVDNFGMLWVGTTTGLSVLLNPSSVIQGNGSNAIFRTITLLPSEYVNDIMVDALNNKWIATNDGVYILNPDGDQVLTIINTNNSPLLTNEVDALATDPNTGTVYFGTRSGLFSATSLAVKPLQSYNITCHPQPYNPLKNSELIIDGLAQDTEFRILSIDGTLIRDITVTGRKASWDGRKDNGELVSSGIYLIVASSSSIGASSVGKFAVIRH